MPLPKMTKIIAKPRPHSGGDTEHKPEDDFGSRTPVIEDDPRWTGFTLHEGCRIDGPKRTVRR